MNKKTLRALSGSIAKWEAIVAGTSFDKGTENCQLCTVFYVAEKGCDGCPVKAATGEDFCWGSPYDKWLAHTLWNYHSPEAPSEDVKKCSTCLRHAQVELAFLRSLLPEAADA